MYDKCYFCLDQLPKLKKESTASFFVNFGGAGVQKSRLTLLYKFSGGVIDGEVSMLDPSSPFLHRLSPTNQTAASHMHQPQHWITQIQQSSYCVAWSA